MDPLEVARSFEQPCTHITSLPQIRHAFQQKITYLNKLDDYVGVLKAFLEFKFCQKTMDDPRWQKTMEQEMSLMRKNQTWRLEDLPPNKVPIICKWVYKVKKTTARQLENLKARLVA